MIMWSVFNPASSSLVLWPGGDLLSFSVPTTKAGDKVMALSMWERSVCAINRNKFKNHTNKIYIFAYVERRGERNRDYQHSVR